jgi:hypothetical protein
VSVSDIAISTRYPEMAKAKAKQTLYELFLSMHFRLILMSGNAFLLPSSTPTALDKCVTHFGLDQEKNRERERVSERKREKERERERERVSERKREREKGRQRGTKREREIQSEKERERKKERKRINDDLNHAHLSKSSPE